MIILLFLNDERITLLMQANSLLPLIKISSFGKGSLHLPAEKVG